MSGENPTDSEETCGRCPKCGDEFPWVRLFPYNHQVSGHHRVMLFNDSTICKPLMSKEYDFYKSVPPNIIRFVPNLKGRYIYELLVITLGKPLTLYHRMSNGNVEIRTELGV